MPICIIPEWHLPTSYLSNTLLTSLSLLCSYSTLLLDICCVSTPHLYEQTFTHKKDQIIKTNWSTSTKYTEKKITAWWRKTTNSRNNKCKEKGLDQTDNSFKRILSKYIKEALNKNTSSPKIVKMYIFICRLHLYALSIFKMYFYRFVFELLRVKPWGSFFTSEEQEHVGLWPV